MNGELRAKSVFAQDSVQRFQNILDELVGIYGHLAATAAIDVRGAGRHYFVSGHADLERRELAHKDHLYQIGSQSKTFVALALWLLERSGKLSLDDLVSRHLALPIDPRITVRHLLTNSCGLGEFTYAIPPARRDSRVTLTPRDLIALALPQGQIFPPGERFDYCNTGWAIAALLIEALCDQPYGEAIDALILRPLGLRHTSFGKPNPRGLMLRGYIGSQATEGLVDVSTSLDWVYGAGDGISTLDNLLDFYGSLIDARSTLDTPLSVLTSKLMYPAESPYFPMSFGTAYGLGIERRAWAGQEVWGHPGSTTAYLTGTWVDPARGVVVSTCVSTAVSLPLPVGHELRYSRQQLFAMALNTAYALAEEHRT